MRLITTFFLASLLSASAEIVTLTARNRTTASVSPVSSTKSITLAEGESATIRLTNFSTLNQGLATFDVKRKATAPSSSPSVVVIPDDGSGDHEVTLESSSDMVTWTTTQPGTFNSSNSNRFFRVRVKKSED